MRNIMLVFNPDKVTHLFAYKIIEWSLPAISTGTPVTSEINYESALNTFQLTLYLIIINPNIIEIKLITY